MKKQFALLTALCVFSISAHSSEPTKLCNVTICNKIERFSLDIFSHIKDSIGEQCFDIVMPQSEAIVGNVLASDSRWYQGSFNPTKQSVTRIEAVNGCK